MNRRELLTSLGISAAFWPSVSAKARDVLLVGILLAFSQDDSEGLLWIAAFRLGLSRLGWVDGQNCRLEIRWANSSPIAMEALANELVALQADVILASSSPVLVALQKVTKTVPIVFVSVSNPVGAGFVQSLPKPGGNITGIATYEGEIASKWLQKLVEFAPDVNRVAVLLHPDAPAHKLFWRDLAAWAEPRGITPVEVPFRNADDIASNLNAFAKGTGDGLVVLANIIAVANRKLITTIAARHKIPAMYPFRSFVSSGGLMSYGTDVGDAHRQAAEYVVAIFKGASASDLPVKLQTTFSFSLNLSTAASLAITPSANFLASVDDLQE